MSVICLQILYAVYPTFAIEFNLKMKDMKNLKMVRLLCMLFFCSSVGVEAQTNNPKKILVAYFSHTGNTRAVAQHIQKVTGADIFEIVPEVAYTNTDKAQKEIEEGFRPPLKDKVKEFNKYDVIFIGSPCWWATIAPPVATFLTSYDFSGKTLVPFMTHEGSRMGHSEADIRKLCPKAELLQGLPVRGGSAASAEQTVQEWIQKLK